MLYLIVMTQTPFYLTPHLFLNLKKVHNNNVDIKLRSFKLLGIFLDEYLSFNKQVACVCAKLARSNFCLRRIANFVSTKTLRTLYFSMSTPTYSIAPL
jgi:hypothetical protein